MDCCPFGYLAVAKGMGCPSIHVKGCKEYVGSRAFPGCGGPGVPR
jgi:hypothetical protein